MLGGRFASSPSLLLKMSEMLFCHSVKCFFVWRVLGCITDYKRVRGALECYTCRNLTGWWASGANVASAWQTADRNCSGVVSVRRWELISEVKPAVSPLDMFEWHSKRSARLCSFLQRFSLSDNTSLAVFQTPCPSVALRRSLDLFPSRFTVYSRPLYRILSRDLGGQMILPPPETVSVKTAREQ